MNIGNKVVLINGGKEYPSHHEWVNDNCSPEHYQLWKYKRDKFPFSLGMKGTIMYKGLKNKHYEESGYSNPMLYGILTEKGGLHVVSKGAFALGDTYDFIGKEIIIERKDRVYHSHYEWMGKYARKYVDSWVNQMCKIPMWNERGRILCVEPNDWSDDKELLFGVVMDNGNFHIMNGEGIDLWVE